MDDEACDGRGCDEDSASVSSSPLWLGEFAFSAASGDILATALVIISLMSSSERRSRTNTLHI